MEPVLTGKHLGARVIALAALREAQEFPNKFPGKVLGVQIFESTAIVITLLDGEVQAVRYVHNGVPLEDGVGVPFSLRPPRPDDEFDEADYQDPLAEARVDPETAAQMLALAGVKKK
jgi:hypothetical protein